MSANLTPLVALANGVYANPKTSSPTPITAKAIDPFTTSVNTKPNIATAIPNPINTPACMAISSSVGAVIAIKPA